MAVGVREPKDYVDSLFSELEEKKIVPAAKEHLAVTMRPAPTRALAGGSAPGGATPVSSALTRGAAGEDGALAQTGAELPAIPALLAEAVKTVNAAPGIAGYIVRDADGSVAARGGVDVRFADRVSYMTRLAVLVGDELGLEGLREVQAIGAERRMTTVLARDGSALTVLAAADAALDDLSGGKR